MTTYSASLRLWEGTPFDQAIKGAWATPLNTNFNLLENAILGAVAISLGSPATSPLTLSTANGATDQSRFYVQQYTGAISADFTVVMPNVPKYGFAQNSTTGGHNVILDAGAGTNVTLPPDGMLHFYWTDGAGNVTLPSTSFGPGTPGPISGTTGTFSGALSANSITANSGNVTTFGVINLTVSAIVASTINVGIATVNDYQVISGSHGGLVANAGVLSPAGVNLGASGPVAFALSCPTGSVVATSFFATSDGRIKDKVEEITDEEALEYMAAGRPVQFIIDGKPGAGFIAQEEITNGRGASISYVEDLRPEVAKSDGYAPDGHRLLKNYEHDIAYLTKALQNAIARIEVLEQGR